MKLKTEINNQHCNAIWCDSVDNAVYINALLLASRDSAVGIATGYELDDQGAGIRVPVGLRIFSSPLRPDWLWGPPNLLSNGYRE
jgi:hypothetical protein